MSDGEKTKKVDVLLRRFDCGFAGSFLANDPQLVQQLQRATFEVIHFRHYERKRALRIRGVEVPTEGDPGNAVAYAVRKFFGLKYMTIDSIDFEIEEGRDMNRNAWGENPEAFHLRLVLKARELKLRGADDRRLRRWISRKWNEFRRRRFLVKCVCL